MCLTVAHRALAPTAFAYNVTNTFSRLSTIDEMYVFELFSYLNSITFQDKYDVGDVLGK